MPANPPEQRIDCTNFGCEDPATKIMAMPPGVAGCVMVGGYCDEHAATVLEMGGTFASGTDSVFKPEARKIEGRR